MFGHGCLFVLLRSWSGELHAILSVRAARFAVNFDYTPGNLLSFSRWDGSAVETVRFVYNSANQIACLDGDANGTCGDTGDTPYSYDAYGNLTQDGVKTYSYDAENRLLSVTNGTSTTSYTYNGDGDRMSQTVDGITTSYVLDVSTALTQVLAETTSSETTYYLYGLDLVGQSDGTDGEYFAYDGLGSVRQVLDSSSNVLFAQVFDPYGTPYDRAGTVARTSFGFTGEQTDDFTGMIYLRARWYAAGQGRFLTQDPFRGFPERPKSLHRYTYTENNPVNFTDPSGRFIGSPPPPPGLPLYIVNLIRSVSGGCGLPGLGHQIGQFAWDAYGQFTTGLSFEYARSIAWASPQAQGILGPHSSESGWMFAGRIAGDLLAIGSGVPMITGGAGALGGGAIGCGTGVLCIAGAPAMVIGAGAVVAGGTILVGGATGLGQNLSLMAGKGRPGTNKEQKQQFDGAVREIERQLGIKLKPGQIRELHEALHHLEDPGFWDIVNEGLNLFDYGGK